MDQGFDEPMPNTADHAQQYWDQSQAQLEQQYWAQPQQFQPDSAPAPMSMAPAKKPRRGKRVAAGLAIAVVVIVMGIGGFVGFSFWQKAQHQKQHHSQNISSLFQHPIFSSLIPFIKNIGRDA